MTTTTTQLASQIKSLSLLMSDGATAEVRDEAAQKRDALRAQLNAELKRMQAPSYWRGAK
jgi:hypothetical protein